MNTSNSTIPCASGSAASLTIVAFISLLCFLIPFSCAFDIFAHTVNMFLAVRVLACKLKWVRLLHSCDLLNGHDSKPVVSILLDSYPDRLKGLRNEAVSCNWLVRGWGCFSHVNIDLLIHDSFFRTVKVGGQEKAGERGKAFVNLVW